MMRAIVLAGVAGTLLTGCGGGSSPPAVPLAVQQAALPRAFSVTPLNAPASQFPNLIATAPTGIRGILVTATLALQGGATVGALYRSDTKVWLEVQYPGATSTAVYGPDRYSSAYRLAGSYKNAGEANDHGFIYDGVTRQYATIDVPPGFCAPKRCNATIAHSSHGGASYVVVGNFDAVSAPASTDPFAALGHAFLYDGKTFQKIDVPGALSTTAYGVWTRDRSTVVAGGYADAKGIHAYVRDLGSSKSVVYDYPGSKLTHFEGITGVPGAGNYNVVGDYTGAKGSVYGFFLQIRDWKPFLAPVVIGKLTANSVSERTVIGVYSNAGTESGYYAGIPIQDPP
jgi:hypothetical protein